jgi:hypothetical protein
VRLAGLLLTVLLAGAPSLAAAGGQVIALPAADRTALGLLGPGVIGDPVAGPASDPVRFVQQRPGSWTYRVVAGSRKGETEVERLERTPGGARTDWTRTVGSEYVLQIASIADGSLVMPRELVRSQNATVHFEPPLVYLLTGLRPGDRRTNESRMSVYSAENPRMKRYSGRITGTTIYVGAYTVQTPAGRYEAALIRSEYTIEVYGLVSVWDVLHTLYVSGVGKVAEIERRRVSAVGVPMPGLGLETAKVLVEHRLEPDVVDAPAVRPAARESQAP